MKLFATFMSAALLMCSGIATANDVTENDDNVLYTQRKTFAGGSETTDTTYSVERNIGDWVIIKEYEISNGDNTTHKKVSYSRNRHSFGEHYPVFYMGLSRLADEQFSATRAANIAQNQSKCWDWGVYLFDNTIAVNRNRTIGLTYSFGFGRSSYKTTDHKYFCNNDRTVGNYGTLPDEKTYDETWFRYWSFRLPVNVEFQRTVGGNDLFFTVGPELEYRFAPCSKGRMNGHKMRTITRDIDLNPINVNLMAQLGYSNVGFIAKASLVDLFNDRKGNANVYPITLGFSIFY